MDSAGNQVGNSHSSRRAGQMSSLSSDRGEDIEPIGSNRFENKDADKKLFH